MRHNVLGSKRARNGNVTSVINFVSRVYHDTMIRVSAGRKSNLNISPLKYFQPIYINREICTLPHARIASCEYVISITGHFFIPSKLSSNRVSKLVAICHNEDRNFGTRHASK